MSVDTGLWLSGSITEAAVIGLLIYRRMWRSFPIFLAYSVWTLVGAVGAYIVHARFPSFYLTSYFILTLIDSVLLFGVLVELGWSTISPMRASLPRSTPIAVGLAILVLGAVIWPFASLKWAADMSREMNYLLHVQQTFSILRVVVFLLLAGFSQLLAIGWRDRELQIATGLGFTSIVGLAADMLRTHPEFRSQIHLLSEIVVASYLCSLLYWIVSFAQSEQRRREFTPQMQNMLLAVAGAARATRVALADSRSDKPHN